MAGRLKQLSSRVTGLLIVTLTFGCGGPTEPSGWIEGTYQLTLSTCAPGGGSQLFPMTFRADANSWTFVESDRHFVGKSEGQSPPFNWTGQVSGKLVDRRVVEVTAFSYQDSSSHTEIRNLTSTGIGSLDGDEFAGTLAGSYTVTPVFGGVAGTTRSCDSTGMPFRFSREH